MSMSSDFGPDKDYSKGYSAESNASLHTAIDTLKGALERLAHPEWCSIRGERLMSEAIEVTLRALDLILNPKEKPGKKPLDQMKKLLMSTLRVASGYTPADRFTSTKAERFVLSVHALYECAYKEVGAFSKGFVDEMKKRGKGSTQRLGKKALERQEQLEDGRLSFSLISQIDKSIPNEIGLSARGLLERIEAPSVDKSTPSPTPFVKLKEVSIEELQEKVRTVFEEMFGLSVVHFDKNSLFELNLKAQEHNYIECAKAVKDVFNAMYKANFESGYNDYITQVKIPQLQADVIKCFSNIKDVSEEVKNLDKETFYKMFTSNRTIDGMKDGKPIKVRIDKTSLGDLLDLMGFRAEFNRRADNDLNLAYMRMLIENEWPITKDLKDFGGRSPFDVLRADLEYVIAREKNAIVKTVRDLLNGGITDAALTKACHIVQLRYHPDKNPPNQNPFFDDSKIPARVNSAIAKVKAALEPLTVEKRQELYQKYIAANPPPVSS